MTPLFTVKTRRRRRKRARRKGGEAEEEEEKGQEQEKTTSSGKHALEKEIMHVSYLRTSVLGVLHSSLTKTTLMIKEQ